MQRTSVSMRNLLLLLCDWDIEAIIVICNLYLAAKEVMLSLSFLFVSRQDYAKTIKPIFTKFGGKVARGPQKNPLDVDNNPDYDILGY